jgi:hypothetical protein
VGFEFYPGPRARLARRLGAVRAASGAAAFTSAWAQGRAMTLEQAVADALEDVEGPTLA